MCPMFALANLEPGKLGVNQCSGHEAWEPFDSLLAVLHPWSPAVT